MIYNLKDVVESSKRERFNVISTFAGGGGGFGGFSGGGGFGSGGGGAGGSW